MKERRGNDSWNGNHMRSGSDLNNLQPCSTSATLWNPTGNFSSALIICHVLNVVYRRIVDHHHILAVCFGVLFGVSIQLKCVS